MGDLAAYWVDGGDASSYQLYLEFENNMSNSGSLSPHVGIE